MKKRILLTSLLVCGGLLVSACSTSTTPEQTPPTTTETTQPAVTPVVKPPVQPVAVKPQSSHTVQITGYQFAPANLTILKGEKITWRNDDDVDHTVTGPGFDSGVLKNGKTYTHTFSQSGTFDYSCTLHPTMIGKIIVQ